MEMDMMMHSGLSAAVLAGGMGTRLFPITETRPKPLVPIAGRSAIERIFDALRDCGITRVAVTTMFRPEQIEALRPAGLDVRYFRETSPLGTAGSVRQALDWLGDTVAVLAGDAVFDFPLEGALRAHLDSGAEATIVLTTAVDPTEYGVVLGRDGCVAAFAEKPAWRETFSNRVNSGIYFLSRRTLERVPPGRFYDFSKDLFPELLREGVPIRTHTADGYWCDVGNPAAFRDCNLHFSGGETVRGENVLLGRGSRALGSVLFSGVRTGEGCLLEGCVVCENAALGSEVQVKRGAVVGAGVQIGDGAEIGENVRIAPGVKIGKGAVILENIYSADEKQHVFEDEGHVGGRPSLSRALRLGGAAGVYAKGRGVAFMHDGSPLGDALARAAALGASAAGSSPILLGDGFYSLCSFACRLFSPALAVFASADGLTLLNCRGLPLCRAAERRLESLFFARETPAVSIKRAHDLSCELKNGYFRHLLLRAIPLWRGAILETDNAPSMFLKTALLRRTRTRDLTEGETRFFVSDDGRTACASLENGFLSFWHLAGTVLLAEQARGRTAFELPDACPAALRDLLKDRGCTFVLYDEAGEGNDRPAAGRLPWLLDGPTLVLEFLAALQTLDISADDVPALLPRFFVKTKTVDYDEDRKSARIAALAEKHGVEDGRVRVRTDRGTVTVSPLFHGGFRLVAEAVSSEVAAELCDFVGESLRKDESGDGHPEGK